MKPSPLKNDNIAALYMGKAIRKTLETAPRDPEMDRERKIVWAILQDRLRGHDWAELQKTFGWESEPMLITTRPMNRQPIYARDFVDEPTPTNEIVSLVIIGRGARAFLESKTMNDEERRAWGIVYRWIEAAASKKELSFIAEQTGFISPDDWEEICGFDDDAPIRPFSSYPASGAPHIPSPK